MIGLQDKLWAALPGEGNQQNLHCENSGKTGSDKDGLSNRCFKEQKPMMSEKRRDFSRAHN